MGLLGASRRPVGLSWKRLGARSGPFWGIVGASGGLRGGSLGPLWGLLGPRGALWGPLGSPR
eukprot:8677873-Pyramimonas_sp.AAC.1